MIFLYIVADELDFEILVCEFEIQSRCYFHFLTNDFGIGPNSFLPTVIHIYQPLCSGRIWHKVKFLSRV